MQQFRVEALVRRGLKNERRVTLTVTAPTMDAAYQEAVRAVDGWVQQNIGTVLPVYPSKHWQRVGRMLVYNGLRTNVSLYVTY
jgi:hypothetical protein